MDKKAKKDADAAGDGEDDIVEMLGLKESFEEVKQLGEEAINELMSDEIQPHISNSGSLVEKLFGYQETLGKALKIIDRRIEEKVE